MEINNTLLDHGEALARHTAESLIERFEKNVDTENMPNWDLVWKGYHLMRDLSNLKWKQSNEIH